MEQMFQGQMASHYNQQWRGHRNVRSEALRKLLPRSISKHYIILFTAEQVRIFISRGHRE